ncbi:MAG: hypothetical protein QM765_11065 [Myxococcales bacterium]
MTPQPTPAHPGQIEFVDGNTGKVTRVAKAAEVPEALRFAPTDKGLVPVVKVVATVEGERRTIREYGPAGEVLRSTVQVSR